MAAKYPLQTGTLLVSKPLIGDGFFEQSVIYLTEHNAEGSLGFTLNKVSSLMAQDLVDNLPGQDPIFYGGPVQQDALFFLHRFDSLKGARYAGNGLYLGGDFQLLQEALRTAKELDLKDRTCRFFLGYSGWSPGQLESELDQDTWVILKELPGIDPLEADQNVWRTVMRDLGGDYSLWANAPEDPWMN